MSDASREQRVDLVGQRGEQAEGVARAGATSSRVSAYRGSGETACSPRRAAAAHSPTAAAASENAIRLSRSVGQVPIPVERLRLSTKGSRSA